MSIQYYNQHAKQFAADTLSVDMSPLYDSFLPLLPAQAHILDAGCRAGRDAANFLQLGYRVSVQNAKADSKSWLAYWNKNPVHFSCQQDKGSSQAWFIRQDEQLALNFNVAPELHDAFAELFHELLDLRLAQYSQRKAQRAAPPYPPATESHLLQVAETSGTVDLTTKPRKPVS